MDPKTLIDDDQYESLKARFLYSGRGRPKSLPQCSIDNRLLIQLAYLKEEGCKPWSIIDKWLEEIIADIPSIKEASAATQFTNLVQSVLKWFQRIPDSDKEQFLTHSVDLDYISETFSSFGITKKTFMFPPKEMSDPAVLLPIRAVVDLDIYRRKQGLPRKPQLLWISQLTSFSFSKIPYTVDSVMKSYIAKLKNSHRDPDALQDLLNSFLSISSVDKKKTDALSPVVHVTPQKKVKEVCVSCKKLEEHNVSLLDVIQSTQKEKKVLESRLGYCEQEILRLKENLFFGKSWFGSLTNKIT